MQREGVVTAKSQYGIILGGGEDWLNWSKEEYRHGDWEADKVAKGDTVVVEVDEKGKFISSIKVLSQSQDVTPEATSDTGEARDGQFRSPLDFRRTSALAQAVAFLALSPDATAEDVIAKAAIFEKYLEGGYERS